jgi:CO/xanthine dehydrogenase Mo-binding subunit
LASLQANPRLGQWLAIGADGSVTVRSGKVEIGQGIRTALAQIVAQALEVDLSRVRMLSADTAVSPNEGVTAGSLSITDSGGALRQVCAQTRQIYLDAAARQFGLDAEQRQFFGPSGPDRIPGAAGPQPLDCAGALAGRAQPA